MKTYIISDACDETGRGRIEISVSERQLDVLLDHDLIYEDTVSEYVEGSGRRHFHPMHENISIGELVDLIDQWPGHGAIALNVSVYEAAGDLTINVSSNKYLVG